jgi:hypothetical protein
VCNIGNVFVFYPPLLQGIPYAFHNLVQEASNSLQMNLISKIRKEMQFDNSSKKDKRQKTGVSPTHAKMETFCCNLPIEVRGSNSLERYHSKCLVSSYHHQQQRALYQVLYSSSTEIHGVV